MRLAWRLAAIVGVPVLGIPLGMAAGATVAHAASGYTDTSVQASNFVWQHEITDAAAAANVTSTYFTVTGLLGDQPFSTNKGVTYAIKSGADVDGVALSVTTSGAPGETTGGVSANGTLNAGAVAPVDATITLTATDTDGDVAIVTVPVAVGDDSVQWNKPEPVLTDEVNSITAGNTNPDGSVTFAAKDTDDDAYTISESNLPPGLTSGNPSLLPGTAIPQNYNDLQVTATDANGASATGSFLLKVNGGATPAAPVPVLSHGSATYVAATRENVYFDTSVSTWVHFQIVGPGVINGHQGWVYATAGALNHAVYSGLEANHTYTVYYTPVEGQGSTVQVVGTHTGYVVFVTNRP
jgi:hypothetical protein